MRVLLPAVRIDEATQGGALETTSSDRVHGEGLADRGCGMPEVRTLQGLLRDDSDEVSRRAEHDNF